MNKRQRKKEYTKRLFCTRIKNKCNCGNSDLDLYILTDARTHLIGKVVICESCKQFYYYTWVNRSKVKVYKV